MIVIFPIQSLLLYRLRMYEHDSVKLDSRVYLRIQLLFKRERDIELGETKDEFVWSLTACLLFSSESILLLDRSSMLV